MPTALPPTRPRIDTAAQALVEPSQDQLTLEVEVRPRQCGRCRLIFEGDPTLHPTALPEWWLCPACRVALWGERRRSPAAVGPDSSVGRNRAR
jgi:hypothetical protein